LTAKAKWICKLLENILNAKETPYFVNQIAAGEGAMGEDLLKKLKEYSRTSVVHSNTNPYAAVAVAGMMAARSQEAGRYFRLSDTFVPMLAALAPEEHNSVPGANQIELDFKNDWIGYLRTTGLPACGLKYKDKLSPEDNTIRFLNAYNRRIPTARPRTVHESRELTIPPQFQDYEALVALIKAGGDLKPYLSRHIVERKRPDWNDGLLNSWGIQHLHFRIEGTDHLLFCVITDADVYLIQVLPHVEEEWVNTQLIQMLHDNWPETIARSNHRLMRPEAFSTSKRQSLRSYNANFAVTVADGTVYLPLAGGTTASGDSIEDHYNCRKIFEELKFWQETVSLNVLAIRSSLNMPEAKKLTIHMAFDNRICCFYEPTQAARLGGFAGLIID
jgi:hypothetical protein